LTPRVPPVFENHQSLVYIEKNPFEFIPQKL
jgi:hypothetical protein